MQLRKWFENVDLTKVKLHLGIMEADWEPREPDRDAAWELYVELLTRVALQPLATDEGQEKAALDSVHSIFSTTREILRRHGRDCIQFSKVAVVVLNQVIRPFTAKWHGSGLLKEGADHRLREQFRAELEDLQSDLKKYVRLLSNIAMVEDLTDSLT